MFFQSCKGRAEALLFPLRVIARANGEKVYRGWYIRG